jgi:transcription termination factor Rho
MAVLQRKDLEASPLADLHAIASELGLEGFRNLRKPDLIGAILVAQGDISAADEYEPDEVPSDETLEGPPVAGALRAEDEAEVDDQEEEEEGEEDDTSEDTSEGTSEDTSEDDSDEEAADDGQAAAAAAASEEEDEEAKNSDEEIAGGVLDILANGSGFLRLDPGGQTREDVYVSPAQIRRCELRAGDEVSGPVRPPRRNERHPSLVRVETVNGAEAEPPERRPWFGDLTPVFPSEPLSAPGALEGVPLGKGSRVAVSGPPGAGATTLLRELAKGIGEQHADVAVSVVLAGVRPEEVGEWREAGFAVAGGSFESSPEAQAQAAELAVERAKRQVERGGHAAIIVDALVALPAGTRRRVFGAGRATEEGGTLTVVAATGDDREALRWATTRVVLEGDGRVAGGESGTLRAERLAT